MNYELTISVTAQKGLSKMHCTFDWIIGESKNHVTSLLFEILGTTLLLPALNVNACLGSDAVYLP